MIEYFASTAHHDGGAGGGEMALIKLTTWAQYHYADGSRPALSTLRRRALAGDLPYYIEQQGRTLYIDPDRPAYADPLVQSLIDKVLSNVATPS